MNQSYQSRLHNVFYFFIYILHPQLLNLLDSYEYAHPIQPAFPTRGVYLSSRSPFLMPLIFQKVSTTFQRHFTPTC